MTTKPTLFGPVSRRLLGAFGLVTVVSVALLTAAAMIGTDRGLNAVLSGERQHAANQAAVAAAAAFQQAGGWTGADLTAVQAIADGAGARLIVRNSDSAMVWPGRAPSNAGPGKGSEPSALSSSAAVVVSGQTVGTIGLYFGTAGSGRSIAWTWVAVAAVVALAVAVAMSGYVARRLLRPLGAVTRAARDFGQGNQGVRAPEAAPGELGELAQAFNTMADQVVRTEQTRRRLAADVAHELRTPLAALQAGLEELRDGLLPADPARLGGLHDQVLRLGRVVGDLAQLSAAESAALSLHLSDADLGEIVVAALAGQEPSLRAAGLKVTTDLTPGVLVRADPDRLVQAIANLLANAARYCRPGDEVAVRVGKADHVATVRIADSGPGIDPAELPHVFERLWRGKDSASVAGSGIGLAVVRELVAAHAGTVSIESVPGHGTAFTINLPLIALRTKGIPVVT